VQSQQVQHSEEGRRMKCQELSDPFSFPFYRESWYISQLFVLALPTCNKQGLGLILHWE